MRQLAVIMVLLLATYCPSHAARESVAGAKQSAEHVTHPVVFFLDSSYTNRYATTWGPRLQQVFDTAVFAFEQQFDAHFELTKVINVRMAHSSSISVDAAFNALVANRYPGGDTISVLLYSDSTINPNDPIGETEFGRKQIALHETEYENRDDIRGWAIVQALALLHELGHSFGAIHVSDAYSVMNHSPSPVGSFTFDTVNATIIRGALAHAFGFGEQTKYLQTVTHTLRTTGYRLADYPSFFQNYLPPAQSDEYGANVQRVVSDDQLLQSAIGLRMLSQGDSAAAIAIFDGLSKADSTMAALLYYRALATRDIETSNAYLHRAADMGYYLAQELLHVRMKQ